MHHDWADLRPPEAFPYPDFGVQVRGDLAVFTRPELTSERVSYPILTPPAAEGILSAVSWKPEIRWVITAIEVLAPVTWTTMRRNESGTAITRSHQDQGYLDLDDAIQQRMTTLLRDVHYRIRANAWVHPDVDDQDAAKWRDMLQRRVRKGQSFRQPFLGMREFIADIFPDDDTPPIKWDEDLGIMSHRIDYLPSGKEEYDWFEAKVVGGVMQVPRLGLLAQQRASLGAS